MKDELTPEQYSVWEKLHREEVEISRKAENSVDFNSFFEFRKGNYKDDTPIVGL
ncbi:hypothetical protein [Butyrivibrio sp. AE3004]|uniref:hypothetical protein n=1 Tax=Butyrivibrio sp. AE3004 TaxID=1506994 RepID=UPI000B328937|nr:hypothetical protein [Butyrivibrio sp. AE3004]